MAGSDPWGSKLDDICDALDEAEVRCPKTWAKRGIKDWADAGCTERTLAAKNIKYYLDKTPSL